MILSFAFDTQLYAADVTTTGAGPDVTTTGSGPDVTSTGGSKPVSITISNPFRFGDSLYALVEAIVNNILLPIGGVLCVLAFIYAGFNYITARGDEKKIQAASRALLWTAVGTALLLGSWVLAKAIQNTINQII